MAASDCPTAVGAAHSELLDGDGLAVAGIGDLAVALISLAAVAGYHQLVAYCCY